MQLKKVCLFLLGILFLFLINGIAGIANHDYEKNLLLEEDRRAAEPDNKSDNVKSETQKRGLFLSTSGHSAKPQTYQHSNYGTSGNSFSSPGFSYGSHSNTYLPPSGHGFTSYGSDHSGHGSSGFGFGSNHGTGHGTNYGHSGHGVSYGQSGHSGGLGGHNAYALKGLLIPLAGIALLGAAAALSTNPVLLQLGVVNGRRRRRSLPRNYPKVYPANPFIKPKIASVS